MLHKHYYALLKSMVKYASLLVWIFSYSIAIMSWYLLNPAAVLLYVYVIIELILIYTYLFQLNTCSVDFREYGSQG